MKRISAVICELNPLHDGHRYVFSRAREKSDILIAVMSGNFVQRGESAVYDKYRRAEATLGAGADIVLELPFPYSSSSAEFFAAAGVRIAEKAGADALYFGSECGDIAALRKAGAVLSGEEYKEAMTVGRSAALRSQALRSLCPELPSSLFESPNDILGAEYCRRASIETVAVKRISTESASAIRKRCIGSGSDMLDPARLLQLEYCRFRTLREPVSGIAECGGGVFERLYNTALQHAGAEEWFNAVRTKQYTDSRLRRAALFALCSVRSEEMKEDVLFTNLLAAGERGREYLSALKKESDFPIIANHSEKKYLEEGARRQVALADFADNIYALCEERDDPSYYIRRPPVITR